MSHIKKETFNITGMSCAACAARVEKKISATAGVESVAVNLLMNSMNVVYDGDILDAGEIIKKVKETGYGADLKQGTNYRPPAVDRQPPLNLTSTPRSALHTPRPDNTSQFSILNSQFKFRLIVSAIFTVPLFYLSMGDMLKLPLPPFFTGHENALVYAFTLFLLCLPVILVNRKYFITGFKSLWKRAPNMDTLVAIGSGAAFLYGVFAVYMIGRGLGINDADTVHRFVMNLYFESAAMILTLVTFGKFLETRAKGKTGEAIERLMNLTPKTATAVRGGAEIEIPLAEAAEGDILIVKTGAAVPADGVITDGYGSLDESAITGESLPVDKNAGDKVTGGTVNVSGYFKMEAKAVGRDTVVSKIIRLVEDAAASKAPVAKLADKVSGVFVPAVLAIAVITLTVWLILGFPFESSLTAAVSVLVISCPCALGLATPAAITVGIGKGAQNGILLKSAEALQKLRDIDTVVLDKTGTVTEGKPAIIDIIPAGADRNELIKTAASLERMSSHPLAAPIVAEAAKAGISLYEVSDFEIIPGKGVSGTVNGGRIFGGNRRIFETTNDKGHLTSTPRSTLHTPHSDITSQFSILNSQFSAASTPLYFIRDNECLGTIILADTVKATSVEAVAEFKRIGLGTVMLTGDNAAAAEFIANQAGIDKVIAEAAPADKEKEIRALQEQGKKVAMIGDGINDAPALSRADVGIAIGAGTDIAIESADVVLNKGDLRAAAAAVRLSKNTMRIIRQNLFWAFIYNIVGIPIAAGVFYGVFGWLLNPMIAAAAMSLSSVSVVLNALRLKTKKI